MKISEKKLRYTIRSYLIESRQKSKDLNEGFFDFISDFFGGMAATLSAGFDSADYKGSERASTKEPEPKTNVYDQVYLLGDVMWHVGSGIDLAIQTAEYVTEDLEEIEFPDTSNEQDVQEFFEKIGYLSESVATSVGYLRNYWENAPSKKIKSIASRIEVAESLTATMQLAADQIAELESLNPVDDWSKIKASPAVKKALEDTSGEQPAGGTGEPMAKQLEWGDSGIKNIDRIDDLKDLYETIYEKMLEVEEVTSTLGSESGATPEASNILD